MWDWFFAIVPGIILFLYGIEQFSQEVQRVAQQTFRPFLEKWTKTSFRGVILGTTFTALVQSSAATTIIVTNLVNNGILSFSQSLGIILGSRLGTTLTAQLVALKVTAFAPLLIVIGFVISLAGKKWRFLGKPIFYFGLVFFSLTLIEQAIAPYALDPSIQPFFEPLSNPFIGVIVGFILTAILQSSSITIGLLVVLGQTNLVSLSEAIPFLLGATIGSTIVTWLVSRKMGLYARKTAFAHILFSVIGVLLILPLLSSFELTISQLGGSLGQQIANAHLFFNLGVVLFFIFIIPYFESLVHFFVRGSEPEVLLKPKFIKLNTAIPELFTQIEHEIEHAMSLNHQLFRLAVQSVSQPKEELFLRVEKLEAVSDYLSEQISKVAMNASTNPIPLNESKRAVLLVRMSNAVEQFGDLGEDLARVGQNLSESDLSLSSESIKEIHLVSHVVNENIQIMQESLPCISLEKFKLIKKNDVKLSKLITQYYPKHFKRMANRQAYAGTTFTEIISILESVNEKVREIRKLSLQYARLIRLLEKENRLSVKRN